MRILNRLTALVLTLALTAIPLSGQAADPVEINAIMSLTGAIAFVGKEAAISLGVAQDTINKAGGIGGRPIKFVIQDDGSNPQIAVQIANGLLAKNIQVILGPVPVAACNAVAPLIKDKAVMFCNSAAFRPPPHSNAYSAGVSTIDQFVFAVRYLRQRGLKKLGSMTSNDASGQDADKGLTLAMSMPENAGVSLVAAEHFNPTDLTVTAQMVKIKGSGAQAVFTSNSGTQLGIILHDYTNLGLDVPIVASAAALNYTTVTQFAAILPKELLIAGVLSDGAEVVPNGPVKAAQRILIDAMRGAGVDRDHGVSVNWDPIMIIVGALRKYGPNASQVQINSFIENLHGWAGSAGEYDFRNGSPNGLSANSLVMVRWNAEKKAWSAVSKPGGAPLSAAP